MQNNIVRYSDFGAAGDGIQNDFSAIKAAHDYANERGLAVEGTAGKTYRLGDNGTESIIIKTDTLWSGCAFILDDSDIMPDDPCRTVDLFKVLPDKQRVKVEGVTALSHDAKNIGVALGFAALVHITNENQRRYIRNGLNQDKGDAQREIVIVDKDGNIDPTTPLCWDYEEITNIFAVPIDEEPVIIHGGNFIRYANHAPNEYTYYSALNQDVVNELIHMITSSKSKLEYNPSIIPRTKHAMLLADVVSIVFTKGLFDKFEKENDGEKIVKAYDGGRNYVMY